MGIQLTFSGNFADEVDMGFYVRKVKRHNYSVWEELTVPTRKRGPVPRESYTALGFNYDWTFEEADKWCKHLNKKNQFERRKVVAAARRVEESKLVDSIYLPKNFVDEFLSHLEELTLGSEERLETLKIHWKTARQKIILPLEISPDQFYDSKFKIFNIMMREQYSIDYIKRLRYILNEWGKFYARKTKTYFEPIPALSGSQREKMLEASEEKENVRRPAAPLLWPTLQSVEVKFKDENLEAQWNWLFIAVWFGLRPKEVDSLQTAQGKFWRIERKSDLVELHIYQTKLRGIPKSERWKPIPVYFSEQKKALEIILSKEFKRPLVKTLNRLIGDGIDTYSPRKAFTDFMLAKGFALDDVAIFLGHRDISQTWQAYKGKRVYKLPDTGT